MASPDTLAIAVSRSSALSRLQVKDLIPPEHVAAVLLKAGVDFLLVGAHAIGGWTRRPRATADVDILIATRAHRKAVAAIAEAYPQLRKRDVDVVTRFLDPKSAESLIDLIKPKSALLRTAFDHRVTIKLGRQALWIPDLEMAAALKFAAMIGVYRKRADKEQDGVDFRRIVEANAALDLAKLARLGELVYPGGAAEVRRLVEAARKGEPLVF